MTDIRIIHARIVLDTALHVGSGESRFPTDSPFRRSGDGRLVIPGRALGGCLRSTATRLAPYISLEKGRCRAIRQETGQESKRDRAEDKKRACGCITCQLFGDRYPNEEQQEAAASRLWVYDAFEAGRVQTHVRDGVGLSRAHRAAARNVKFDYEIIPAKTSFDFALMWEPGDRNIDEQAMLLAAALQEWVEGRGQLGSSAARGLGQFHLEGLRSERIDLGTPDQLINYLSSNDHKSFHGSPDGWLDTALAGAVERVRTVKQLPQNLSGAAGWFVRIDFDLLFQGQFLTNDPLAAAITGFDHAPLAEVLWDAQNQRGLPVISGSSLRGALRARAERIARTLAALRRPKRGSCLICDPLVRDTSQPNVSCAARLEAKNDGQDSETSEEDLCLACRLFGSSLLGSRLWVRDASWHGGAVKWDPRDFLAIDRFTGGGQEGAKFDAAGLVQPCFQSGLVLQNPAGWELGWLALVLRDLAEGQIPLGFGSAKGFGMMKMDHVRWEIGWVNTVSLPDREARLLVAGDNSQSGIYTLRAETVPQAGWKPESLTVLLDAWVQDFHMKIGEIEDAADAPGGKGDDCVDPAASLYGMPWSAKGVQK